LQPGGNGDLRRFENMATRDVVNPSMLKVPRRNVRLYYDLAGLPEDVHSEFGLAHEKLQHSPESIKRDLWRRVIATRYEIWRLYLSKEEISWTAQVSGPAGTLKAIEAGSSESWHWEIDSERGNEPKRDKSIKGRERLWFRNQEFLAESGTRHLVQWKLFRKARCVMPRLKLSDLKEVAPWFYQHIPRYVLDREDWFHFGETDSIAVYIDHHHKNAPRMVEFVGNYCFEGMAKEKRFDAFFDPEDFRRIHIRGASIVAGFTLNFTRPCRECDVLVLDAPHCAYRVRFMVPEATPAKE